MRDMVLRTAFAFLLIALAVGAPTPAPAADTAAAETFGGIGAEVRIAGNTLEIVRVLEGKPAASAGLLSGDRITQVDGRSVAGLALPDAVALLRGPAGSTVTITVDRGDGAGPFDVTVTREAVTVAAAAATTEEAAAGQRRGERAAESTPSADGATGIRLTVAAWVPPRDADYGRWGAVPTGTRPQDQASWSNADEPLTLPPGTYDVYWQQTYDHRDRPLLLAAGVQVGAGQIASVSADSGIRLEIADWVPARDETYGWWGAVPAGGTAHDAVNWTKADTALLLPPGTYDVYWQQTYDHRDRPMLLAAGLAVDSGSVAALKADSGIRLQVADWVPARDETYGWWGATAAGGDPDDTVNWTKADGALLLPPGSYDVYWVQTYDQRDRPLRLAAALQVEPGKVATVTADSGIALDIAGWVPARDETYGWWGASPAGGSPRESVNWSRSDRALLLVPGSYDVYWVQDYDQRDAPLRLAAGLAVAPGQVATVAVRSGIALKLPPGTPALDGSYGWWGILPSGADVDSDPLIFSKGRFDRPLPVPPGTYDVLWKQDYESKVKKIALGVVAEVGVLVEIATTP